MKVKKNFHKLFNNSKLSKIYIILLLVFLAYLNENIFLNKSFDKIFKKYFCAALSSKINSKCENKLFVNYNFFYEFKRVSRNITLLINENLSKIENILLLIAIIPNIKEKSIIYYKINNKKIDNLLNNIFKDNKIYNNIIKFTHEDFNSVKILINSIIHQFFNEGKFP